MAERQLIWSCHAISEGGCLYSHCGQFTSCRPVLSHICFWICLKKTEGYKNLEDSAVVTKQEMNSLVPEWASQDVPSIRFMWSHLGNAGRLQCSQNCLSRCPFQITKRGLSFPAQGMPHLEQRLSLTAPTSVMKGIDLFISKDCWSVVHLLQEMSTHCDCIRGQTIAT
jgi:hypothetical protein